MKLTTFQTRPKNRALALALAVCCAAPLGVGAEPIFINTGTDLNGDGNSLTAVFQNLGLLPDANSRYTELPGGRMGFSKTERSFHFPTLVVLSLMH